MKAARRPPDRVETLERTNGPCDGRLAPPHAAAARQTGNPSAKVDAMLSAKRCGTKANLPHVCEGFEAYALATYPLPPLVMN